MRHTKKNKRKNRGVTHKIKNNNTNMRRIKKTTTRKTNTNTRNTRKTKIFKRKMKRKTMFGGDITFDEYMDFVPEIEQNNDLTEDQKNQKIATALEISPEEYLEIKSKVMNKYPNVDINDRYGYIYDNVGVFKTNKSNKEQTERRMMEQEKMLQQIDQEENAEDGNNDLFSQPNENIMDQNPQNTSYNANDVLTQPEIEWEETDNNNNIPNNQDVQRPSIESIDNVPYDPALLDTDFEEPNSIGRDSSIDSDYVPTPFDSSTKQIYDDEMKQAKINEKREQEEYDKLLNQDEEVRNKEQIEGRAITNAEKELADKKQQERYEQYMNNKREQAELVARTVQRRRQQQQEQQEQQGVAQGSEQNQDQNFFQENPKTGKAILGTTAAVSGAAAGAGVYSLLTGVSLGALATGLALAGGKTRKRRNKKNPREKKRRSMKL
jgi:hypothetical protein